LTSFATICAYFLLLHIGTFRTATVLAAAIGFSFGTMYSVSPFPILLRLDRKSDGPPENICPNHPLNLQLRLRLEDEWDKPPRF
jgi:hypothetical protein